MAKISPPPSKYKRMTPLEFYRQGYLFELNRQFLHPLGLALSVTTCNHQGHSAESCKHRYGEFGPIWDARDDPEGILYAEPFTEQELTNADCIADDFDDKASARESLGCIDETGVQPLQRDFEPA